MNRCGRVSIHEGRPRLSGTSEDEDRRLLKCQEHISMIDTSIGTIPTIDQAGCQLWLVLYWERFGVSNRSRVGAPALNGISLLAL